jgi:hypothetical protein
MGELRRRLVDRDDPVAASALSGAGRKARGVRLGLPDVLVWYCGKSIAIELKSRQVHPGAAFGSRGLLRAGAPRRVCRTLGGVDAARVPFRAIYHEDGTVEHWQQPELPEVPKHNPHERRPRAPEWKLDRDDGGNCRSATVTPLGGKTAV